MRLLFVVLLVPALAACHHGGAPSADATREVVRHYFQWAEAGDCAQLQRIMSVPDDCENIVRQFRETKTHLVSIDEITPDGRDAAAMLVHTTVAFGKKSDHKWIVRAARAGGGWRLRL